jgi:SAM-dependent methyltransferase
MLRRHERFTGLAVRSAGRLQRLRDRSRSLQERWSLRKGHESGFWRDALMAPGAKEAFADRLDPNSTKADECMQRALDSLDQSEVAILDVGSGPLTSVPKAYPGKELTVTASDALADEYVEDMRRAGIEPPVPPVRCSGEELISKFGEDSFDLVFMANALDHTADPLLVLRNMIGVAKPNGIVALHHMSCEGERNGYFGIHMWNIDNQDGRFVIWNQTTKVDVAEHLGDGYEVDCWVGSDDQINALIRSA